MLLEDQDRERWDPVLVALGLRLTAEALTAGPAPRPVRAAGRRRGRARRRPTFADTRWDRIVGLYDRLLAVWDSPVVALNRAAALAFLPPPDGGPAVALEAVDALAADPRLTGYPYLPAARADLLRRLGRAAEAGAAYEESLGLTQNAAERAFLRGRLAAVRAPGAAPNDRPSFTPGHDASLRSVASRRHASPVQPEDQEEDE